MVQPEAWKEVAHYAGGAWSAVGPLVGILIGAWIARSSERKHWLDDNRKEESRELLRTITHAAALVMNIGSGTSYSQAHEAYLDSVKTFKDRIFIAEEIEQGQMLDDWARGYNEYVNHKIDDHAFSGKAEKVLGRIRGLVVAR